MSEDEIRQYQLQQSAAQAVFPVDYWRSLQNHSAVPALPLDERFASFKKRLGEALAKRS